MDAATRAAIEAVEPAYDAAPDFSDADLDRAQAAAADLRGGSEPWQVDQQALAALAPDDAGRLAQELVDADRFDALEMVLESTPPHRFPLVALMRYAAPVGREMYLRDVLVKAIALAPALRMRAALDEVADDATLDDVVQQVAEVRATLAGEPPYQWWQHAEAAMAEPPEEDGLGAGPEDGTDPDEVVFRGPDDEGVRQRYPRLDVDSGTDKPDVVVVDQPFQVTFGLQPRRDRQLIGTGALALAGEESIELEAVLLFDPASIQVSGSPRVKLTTTELEPFPTATLTCTATYGEDLALERRIGLQLHRDGQVVGVAWRMIVAVDSADRVAGATVPSHREVELLDLDPLLGAEPPDLVVSVCRADTGSTTFVWTAYAADPAVPVPDLPSASTLDDDVAAFATMLRRTIEFSGGSADDYFSLAGRAVQIGRAVPEGIQDAIRSLLQAPGRTVAPTVLLLTEELVVPWELATLSPRPVTTWGRSSPFLGAHVAVSRWPLTDSKPRPRPRSSVAIRQAAVLTADYTGVANWKKLDSALAEAGEVAALFDPPATAVQPELLTVIDLFNSRPEYDVVHAALHGKYDAQGGQEGIVLLKRNAAGATAQFLTPTMLETCSIPHGPFVFLNACQVASDESVLGDYAGFASTLLRIGAGGVVAPLWNVRDDVAQAVAKSFYTATLGADAVSAAEAMRAVRASYTEDGARTDDPQQHATLIAYQVFGHPRLRLTTPTT